MRSAVRGMGNRVPRGSAARPLRHPVPQSPLRHEDTEKDCAAADDGGVRTSVAAAEPGERKEERKHDEPEAREREKWPPRARNAQRQRQTQRREEPVRRAELPPRDDREHDEEHKEREELEV